MGLTVAEAVRELERLTHEREIWMDIVEYLSRCLDHEAPSGKANAYITVREGGAKVPQVMVEKFIDRINGEEIDPLNIAIEELEGLNVYEETDDEDPNKATKGKANKPANKPATRKSRKGIRAVPKPPGIKAQGSS
jgi:hypothetical protein